MTSQEQRIVLACNPKPANDAYQRRGLCRFAESERDLSYARHRPVKKDPKQRRLTVCTDGVFAHFKLYVITRAHTLLVSAKTASSGPGKLKQLNDGPALAMERTWKFSSIDSLVEARSSPSKYRASPGDLPVASILPYLRRLL